MAVQDVTLAVSRLSRSAVSTTYPSPRILTAPPSEPNELEPPRGTRIQARHHRACTVDRDGQNRAAGEGARRGIVDWDLGLRGWARFMVSSRVRMLFPFLERWTYQSFTMKQHLMKSVDAFLLAIL